MATVSFLNLQTRYFKYALFARCVEKSHAYYYNPLYIYIQSKHQPFYTYFILSNCPFR